MGLETWARQWLIPSMRLWKWLM
ncbi:hypothetical protein NC653_023580 [Populus alba x Populus x berolinensis]|uniref:Uncharacterized protein n=1 Tax=Populus alba x Populus x berolinensis TaxID=444605 RepID=A0AAD6QB71_9ROSI|nr:hypothetical protein NC653_023580 [Populus alba x Populus x berolinensis]